ncbi:MULTISPECIES: c-type cytochrome [unclassified Caballeronia]|uniref:c-type cytochrome n=1 Tax=unclassified Caballeronia TaxID=2646786 RepID=UPI0028643E1E|nr:MULTISPECIES: c-type cytochrome [unclassified Caballeronia]MDR5815376.1 cytochrome C [Caballeronia sp. LZ033]MDR5880106.1 cytochrome C [Caballeronia sp. LZ032]
MIRIRSLIVPLVAVLSATGARAEAAIDVARAQQIATQHACFGCHAVDRKLVGPAYRDVAARYKGNAGALATLVTHVQNGSSGSWGAVPMPPNPISTADAQTVVQWILAGSRTN